MRYRVDKLTPDEHFDLWEKLMSEGEDIWTISVFNRAANADMEWFVTTQEDIDILRRRFSKHEVSILSWPDRLASDEEPAPAELQGDMVEVLRAVGFTVIDLR